LRGAGFPVDWSAFTGAARGRASAPGRGSLMDRADVKAKLRAFVLSELIRNPGYPLRDDEPLITGGLIDSFSLAYFGVFVEDTFNLYIPDTDLTVANLDTLDQMVDRVMQGAS